MCSDRNWKNSCFVLPILNKLCSTKQKINTIIVAPTRELVYKLIDKLKASATLPTSSFPVYGGGTGMTLRHRKKPLKMVQIF